MTSAVPINLSLAYWGIFFEGSLLRSENREGVSRGSEVLERLCFLMQALCATRIINKYVVPLSGRNICLILVLPLALESISDFLHPGSRFKLCVDSLLQGLRLTVKVINFIAAAVIFDKASQLRHILISVIDFIFCSFGLAQELHWTRKLYDGWQEMSLHALRVEAPSPPTERLFNSD